MSILGLQGVRGGVGTTSITSALAWALQILGENVLVVDASPDNLLRMSFNVDFAHRDGWARALLDGKDWRDAGLRYTTQLDLLPFGQLTVEERENPQEWAEKLGAICAGLRGTEREPTLFVDFAGSSPRRLTADATVGQSLRSYAGGGKSGHQLPYPAASTGAAHGRAYSD